MPKTITPKTVRKAAKARKSAKNQPTTFRESAAAGLPLTAVAPVPRLSQNELRALLVAAWAAAMILVGAAIGLRVLAAQTVAVQVPPVPVATANLAVSPSAASVITVAATPTQAQPNLTVAPATSVNQAQAGNPIAVLSEITFQPATTFDNLTPGRTHIVRIQGNLGTEPIE
jgi:hypothetical protein